MRSEQMTSTDIELAIEELEAMVTPTSDGSSAAVGAGMLAVGILALAVFC
jgi:hypothetical protein